MVTERTQISPTEPIYSDSVVFNLLEDFLLGIQLKNIDRVLSVFHPDATFKMSYICGEMSITHAIEFLVNLKELDSFNPKIKKVLFDKELGWATGVVEFEFSNERNKGGRFIQICTFKVKNNLIIEYDGGIQENLETW